MAWLGIDLGTSAVKVALVREDGSLLGLGQAPLELHAPEALAAEQSAAAWWRATIRAIRACLDQAGTARIEGIGLTGQKHALLLLDAAGRPLTAARLWADGRATRACQELLELWPHLARGTGAPALPGYFLPKWLHLRAAEPELLKGVAHVLFAKDWIRYQLTGAFATDPTEAGASQLWHAPSGSWDEARSAAVGIDVAWLPRVVPSSGLSGRVSKAAAASTGLPPRIPVVGGAGDNEAAALACGAASPGIVAVILGTSGTVIGTAARQGRVGGLVWGRHVTKRGVAATGTMLSAGRALDWARRAFLPPGTSPAAALECAFGLGDDPAAPLFVPALVGERSPVPDPQARAAFLGLEPSHGPAHLMRAVVDGVSATLGQIVALLRESKVAVAELRLTGGGAESGPWRRQILAAAGCPGRVAGAREGPARGAALLAARMGEGDEELLEGARLWFPPDVLEEPGAEEIRRMALVMTRLARARRQASVV